MAYNFELICFNAIEKAHPLHSKWHHKLARYQLASPLFHPVCYQKGHRNLILCIFQNIYVIQYTIDIKIC